MSGKHKVLPGKGVQTISKSSYLPYRLTALSKSPILIIFGSLPDSYSVAFLWVTRHFDHIVVLCIAYGHWTLMRSIVQHHHHHQVSSALNRLNVMDLHFYLFSSFLIHSLQLMFNQSLILSIYIILDLPLPLFPSILAFNNSIYMLFGLLIICPKYSHFLFLMIFINLRLVVIILSTSSIDLCSFHDILNIHLYVHILKVSILLVKVFVMAYVSAP